MLVKDAHIIRLVDRIGDHYRKNISNRFVRPALLSLALEKQTWDLIETLTEKLETYRYHGFHMDELYRQIAAAARFVSVTRRDLAPTLRNRLPADPGPERILRDMAVNNFNSNLQVFADLVNELFICLVELDRGSAKGGRPVYMSIPELNDIGPMLNGN